MTIRFGLPKGSLLENTIDLLKRAGYRFFIDSRNYFPQCDDEEIQGVLLRAQEMARYVQEGVLDVGLTGKDWIVETGADVIEVCELIYAKSSYRPVRWVLAVPNDSPVNHVRDLAGKRLATEAVQMTRKYLKANGVEADVEFSWGATEVKAPALVDAIVELTETGSSLKAHNLRIIDTVLESTIRFIANKASYQDDGKRKKIDTIAMLLQGAIHATGKVGLKFNIPKKCIGPLKDTLPAMKKPTVSPLLDDEWAALEIIVDESTVRHLIPTLKQSGATDIIEYPLNKIIY